MTKLTLNKKLKAENKSAEAILVRTLAVKPVAKETKNDHIKKQFAHQELIFKRMKNPVIAMACCLIQQV